MDSDHTHCLQVVLIGFEGAGKNMRSKPKFANHLCNDDP